MPAELRPILEPELGTIAEDIIRSIVRAIPAYRRPMRGAFGRGVHTAIDQALRQFLDQMGRPIPAERPGREVYLALGRGELRSGRSLDALQLAYRIGARVAWRRFAAAARAAGVDGPTQALLAEAIFAYIDELSAESVEGYALEQAVDAGERQRQQSALVRAVVSGGPEDIDRLGVTVGWSPPRTLAVLVSRHRHPERLVALAGEGAVGGTVEEHVVLVVPDPDAPGRRARITRAFGSRTAVLGPTVALEHAHASYDRALRCSVLQEAGVIPADGLADSADHLAALVVHADPQALADLAARRLAALDTLTPMQRERMQSTLAAWLARDGSVAEAAADLVVHPQTVRYRVARLRELLGDQLDDADARFELALALRASTG
ncbi:MAG TPA: helix-turn-helix domain-containing protein [Solirubrobacteraceae bacterium]|nr:helix-turn-helix domain-containing protein [Solirubrobacteraceae bacterium]